MSMFKLPKYIREYGFLETFFRLLHRFRIISVLHTFEFVFKELTGLPLSETEFGIQKNGKKISFREIYEYQLDSLKYAEGMYSIDTFRMHFSRGMRFFAAFDGDLIVAVNGVNTRYADLIYIRMPRVHLPEKIVYFNCALTAPAFRNLSIGSALREYRQAQMQREGYQAALAAIFVENRWVLHWNLRKNSQYFGKISYIQFLGRDFWVRRLTPLGRRYPNLLRVQAKPSLRGSFQSKAEAIPEIASTSPETPSRNDVREISL